MGLYIEDVEPGDNPKFVEFLKKNFANRQGSPTYELLASKGFEKSMAFIVERHFWEGSRGGIQMSVAVGFFDGTKGRHTEWFVFRNQWSASLDNPSIHFSEILDVARNGKKIAITVQSTRAESKKVCCLEIPAD